MHNRLLWPDRAGSEPDEPTPCRLSGHQTRSRWPSSTELMGNHPAAKSRSRDRLVSSATRDTGWVRIGIGGSNRGARWQTGGPGLGRCPRQGTWGSRAPPLDASSRSVERSVAAANAECSPNRAEQAGPRYKLVLAFDRQHGQREAAGSAARLDACPRRPFPCLRPRAGGRQVSGQETRQGSSGDFRGDFPRQQVWPAPGHVVLLKVSVCRHFVISP